MSPTKTKDEFREEQQRQAKRQNKLSENAVPEKRPIASQQLDDRHQSETYLKLKENGDLQDEPMPKSAYDKADSEAQAKKAKKDERSPAFREGARVRVTEGPYEGTMGAVVEVNYDTDQKVIRMMGTPESNYAQPSSIRVRTRGGRHALLSLKPNQVELVSTRDYRRTEA